MTDASPQPHLGSQEPGNKTGLEPSSLFGSGYRCRKNNHLALISPANEILIPPQLSYFRPWLTPGPLPGFLCQLPPSVVLAGFLFLRLSAHVFPLLRAFPVLTNQLWGLQLSHPTHPSVLPLSSTTLWLCSVTVACGTQEPCSRPLWNK